MLERPRARLAIAVAVSAGLHAAALISLKGHHAAADGTISARTFLSARLLPRISPVTDDRHDTLPAPPIDQTPPPLRPIEPDTPAPQAAAPSPAAQPSAAENPAQNPNGVRIALPDEVQVRVRLFEKAADENPSEVMQLDSGKYVYFNSPQLKESARPLTDARPHYPTTRLDYPHGAVSLLLLIDEQGKLEKATVLCANPAFEASALASIRDMQFGAARDASGPVKSYMLVDFGYGSGAPCGPLPATLQMQLNQRPG